MRLTILACAALLSACVQQRPASAGTAPVLLTYGDLRLDTREGRAELRARVKQEAERYCAGQGARITPHAWRADPYYCSDTVRFGIMAELPDAARRAYALARREAGVRGRRL
jgi:UrcA family protein